MIYISENNWYGWSYDGNLFSRQEGEQRFDTFFSKSPAKIESFGQELKKAAESTLNTYPDLNPCIFFSGGIDSELVLRTYIDIGATPLVYVARYEDEINAYDVRHAMLVCQNLGIKLNIIDFNLKKFYENDAELISEKSQIDRPRALPQLKFMDYVDGLPIYSAGDLTIPRLSDNYSEKGKWMIRCWEHDIGWSKYSMEINRPAIMQWFKWTPGLVASFTKLNWCQNLINDKFHGKLGTTSTKIMGYKEIYPDIIDRIKKTGFEEVGGLIDEFENFLRVKYRGLPFRNSVDRTIDNLYESIYD